MNVLYEMLIETYSTGSMVWK